MTYDWPLYFCLFLALWSAIVGGTFCAFSEFIMPALKKTEAAGGIEAVVAASRRDELVTGRLPEHLTCNTGSYLDWGLRRREGGQLSPDLVLHLMCKTRLQRTCSDFRALLRSDKTTCCIRPSAADGSTVIVSGEPLIGIELQVTVS